MSLPTEPIGSIPRPKALQDGMGAAAAGEITAEQLDALYRRRRGATRSAGSRRPGRRS